MSFDALLVRAACGQAARVQGAAGFQPQARCHEEACPPSQRAQVYGHVSAAADILLTLPRVHLVCLPSGSIIKYIALGSGSIQEIDICVL